MAKVTIEDISRQTGLSRGTVSRALNDRPDISEQTKQRVLEACSQLNYVPSHAARSLATGRRFAVAVLVSDLRSTYAAAFLRGVLNVARKQRYAVHVIEVCTEEHDPGAAYVQSLLAERVDALLVSDPLPDTLTERIAGALAAHPMVAASANCPIECDVLGPDWSEAGRMAARLLTRGGERSILRVTRAGTSADFCAGFDEVLQMQGIDPFGVGLTVPDSCGPNRLDAVVERLAGAARIATGDDLLAIEILVRMALRGRLAGRDYALMGVGNEAAGTALSPGLTSIDLSGEETGQRAMELALQRVTKSRQDGPQRIAVAPQILERGTTANVMM